MQPNVASSVVRIGKFEIKTTPNHPLQHYLNALPLYDRFLGHLCSELDGVVIDIGANIGDTTTAIHSSNDKLKVISVEPDETFFALLKENSSHICSNRDTLVSVQCFISNVREKFVIFKNPLNSTGHIQIADPQAKNEVNTLTYTELLDYVGIHEIQLVKIDTDGFDHHILESIADHYQTRQQAQMPLIFFEYAVYLNHLGLRDPHKSERHRSYLNAVHRLMDMGLTSFVLFDNFGTPMLVHNDINVMSQLIEYTIASSLKNNRTTIYFLDVLLFSPNQEHVVMQALKNHMK